MNNEYHSNLLKFADRIINRLDLKDFLKKQIVKDTDLMALGKEALTQSKTSTDFYKAFTKDKNKALLNLGSIIYIKWITKQ